MPSSSKPKSSANPPKYAVLEEDLRQKILLLPDGHKLPPIRDLMRDYRVSMATVTRALSNLSDEGIISSHVGRGTFKIRSDQSNSPKQLDLIGVIVPQLDDQFFGRVIRSVEKQCSEAGYNILVRHLDGHAERIHSYFDQLRKAGVSGLIYIPSNAATLEEFQTYNFEFLERFLPSKMPGVVLDQEVSGTHFPCVRSDHAGGAEMLASHLYSLGHRRLVMIDSYPCPSTEIRWNAFSSFLEARKCHVERLIFPGAGHNPTVVRSAVRKLRSITPAVTGIFAANDRIALNILFECQRQGISIPNELSLVGFDDLEIGRLCEPSLTSVIQSLEEIGRQAADIVLRQISSGQPMSAEKVILPVQLVERNSSSIPPE